MSKLKILFVDDEKMLRDALARWFSRDFECLTAPDAEDALRQIDANADLALVVSDVRMPGMTGVELLRAAKAKRPDLPFIMLTAYGTMELAVESMRDDGADDFFQKPVTDLKAFELRIRQVLEKASLRRQVASLKEEVASLRQGADGGLKAFTGKSPAMEKVYALIRKVAPTAATVLVEGPSGTGKELVARAIHELSPRKDKPFVAVECSAFSRDLLESELFGYVPGTFTGGLKDGKKGCIEAANGGTLFLDEIGEIDSTTQIALLRALETKCVRRLGGSQEIPVDFRLVAATNRDLAAMVRDGTFRSDLYYRLKVIDIRTPALKEHRSDIALLAARFLKEFAAQYSIAVNGIEPAALKALEDYDWPGNVRELRNVIEKMVVLATGSKLAAADLPYEITAKPEPSAAAEAKPAAAAAAAAPQSLAESEKRQILAAIEQCDGNKSKAAELLGVSRRTLHRKLKEWNHE